MKTSDGLFQRVEARDQLRDLTRNLLRQVERRRCLRTPAVATLMENAINALNAVADALGDDAAAGSLTETSEACPVCDIDPKCCTRGGNCGLDSDPKRRPELWRFRTIALPSEQMKTINDAVARAQQISAPVRKSYSAALSLVALDFVATNGFTKRSALQSLSFLAETFERAMGLRLVVADHTGKLLYGLDNVALMAASMRRSKRGAIR